MKPDSNDAEVSSDPQTLACDTQWHFQASHKEQGRERFPPDEWTLCRTRPVATSGRNLTNTSKWMLQLLVYCNRVAHLLETWTAASSPVRPIESLQPGIRCRWLPPHFATSIPSWLDRYRYRVLPFPFVNRYRRARPDAAINIQKRTGTVLHGKLQSSARSSLPVQRRARACPAYLLPWNSRIQAPQSRIRLNSSRSQMANTPDSPKRGLVLPCKCISLLFRPNRAGA